MENKTRLRGFPLLYIPKVFLSYKSTVVSYKSLKGPLYLRGKSQVLEEKRNMVPITVFHCKYSNLGIKDTLDAPATGCCVFK